MVPGFLPVTATNETKVDMTAPVLYDVVPQFDFISCISSCNFVVNITDVRDEESGVRSCSYAVKNSSFMIRDFVDIRTEHNLGSYRSRADEWATVLHCGEM